MEKESEAWTPTGVKSTFNLPLQASSSTGAGHRPTALGTGTQYTVICGLGWRFSFRVDQQSAPTMVVDDAGNTIESFQLQLFFDPYLIRLAAYGAITLTTQVEHLISPSQAAAVPIKYNLPSSGSGTQALGTYVYASSAAAPTISITLTFSSTLGLTLPHPLEKRMEEALEETLTGKELVNVKFYAFSRRGSECVTHPLALFANSNLLRGLSEDLDALFTEHGFSESAIVDLDLHETEDHAFNDYGYESDSDLESEADEPSAALVKASSFDVETDAKEQSTTKSNGRNGRVIVLKDTAFKTWKALIYYLYTRRVNFRPLESEGPQETDSTMRGPTCSPKSMYRLADKLGLVDLQALALAAISSRLSEANILQEVFSSFTSVYPVIRDLEVGVLTSNFSDKASERLLEMTQKICDGEKPYCAETLFMIIRKMGGK
ncbi:hypothetical protein C8F04DRAFT_1392825 [Mycena alexandri]|uniref:BTB domain-containing protein n=1 Tax=Mycena alexandri TaxID=1745969 RepID=A0AAD6T6J9_9AGAR|nr:hypothetical protein C8F04DRAFT_1147403 [Mycena alexandri]KAJ7038688.1 hypothetical protein C8F04DRAFT_1392825 [Mycena alexandri]